MVDLTLLQILLGPAECPSFVRILITKFFAQLEVT